MARLVLRRPASYPTNASLKLVLVLVDEHVVGAEAALVVLDGEGYHLVAMVLLADALAAVVTALVLFRTVLA